MAVTEAECGDGIGIHKTAARSFDWPSVLLLLQYDFEAVLLLPRTCN